MSAAVSGPGAFRRKGDRDRLLQRVERDGPDDGDNDRSDAGKNEAPHDLPPGFANRVKAKI